ncbi:hypothetical protein B0I35DRAFT_437106 [Stachybotrys elegans]|uniref:Secreted protein n=1 Tax=Stachybotrys elegans TaxID=80388 RepID=A0A8K0SS44_9HYPO|nr:hypothetical protein B0I35DRAFT_437106 [Stachybotrys elegans]
MFQLLFLPFFSSFFFSSRAFPGSWDIVPKTCHLGHRFNREPDNNKTGVSALLTWSYCCMFFSLKLVLNLLHVVSIS